MNVGDFCEVSLFFLEKHPNSETMSSPTLQPLFFFESSKGNPEKKKNMGFLFAEPLENLFFKKGKTHKKTRKIGEKKNKTRKLEKKGLEGQGCFGFCLGGLREKIPETFLIETSWTLVSEFRKRGRQNGVVSDFFSQFLSVFSVFFCPFILVFFLFFPFFPFFPFFRFFPFLSVLSVSFSFFLSVSFSFFHFFQFFSVFFFCFFCFLFLFSVSFPFCFFFCFFFLFFRFLLFSFHFQK